ILAPHDQAGLLVLLDVEAVRPLEIVATFEPVLQLMWPGAFGGQYLSWSESRRAFILSESLRTRHALIGSPWATEATAHPAHRLAEAPATFRIAVDADRIDSEFIPIAIAAGLGARDDVLATYERLLLDAESLYRAKRSWADSVLSTTTSVDTPDDQLDLALEWAKINLEEQRVCNPDLGCGFVAGWGTSGTSFRPGFGWFFGGDAAMNTLAMDVTGQWDLVAEDLRFLARYQRDDGKIPHEVSQAAAHLDWFEAFPYPYYHADTTPWWMTAVWQYWKASGDDDFLREIWPAFLRAWEWCLSVETDGDGIIENTTGGLAAVEVGEIGAGVHQDVYLASVWTAALHGVPDMARAVGDTAVEARAVELRDLARGTLNEAYWSSDSGFHAFALLRSGGTNDDLTVWPAAGLMFGLFDEGPAEGTLRHLAADAVSTDWGARMLSSSSDLYDPLQYNSGTVWPFVTGFVSLGQYRYRRPWSGLHLMDAVKQMTFDWSLGRHPELLSGAFYTPLDETVPHQFFASSMLPTPLIRGLVGWEPDAPNAAATLAPQIPADWDRMAVRRLWVGDTRVEAVIEREAGVTRVILGSEGPPIELAYVASLPLGSRNATVRVDGEAHAVEAESSPHDLRLPVELTLDGLDHRIEIEWTGGLSVVPPRIGLEPGQTSSGLRIVNFDREDGAWRLSVEGEGGRSYRVRLIGQPVTIQKTVFSSEGADRTSAGARVAYQQDDVTDLELRLPAEETMRRLMTVYLEGAR
ncbi:MAG: GH116 family glycosyl hydrolase, partial [marine benthic group bacterium]|nr:GH116 family glycosyl hydrolase [Gemmatimonadota bacterium]